MGTKLTIKEYLTGILSLFYGIANCTIWKTFFSIYKIVHERVYNILRYTVHFIFKMFFFLGGKMSPH